MVSDGATIAVALVVYRRPELVTGDWFPPPLTEAQVAAIHRHLVASAA